MIVCLIFKLKLVTIVTYNISRTAGRWGCDFKQEQVFLSSAWSPILPVVPTRPPMQRIPGAFSLGMKWQGVIVTTHFHLVLRVRMYRNVPYLYLTVQLRMNLDAL